MATIVNNPSSDGGSGVGGWIIAGIVIIAVVLIAIFVWPGYGAGGGSGTQVTIPDTINVDVAPTGGGAPQQ